MKAENSNANNLNEDKPLDPAVERVRRKMMRLMAISISIMMIGIMAVIGAIFYKISGSPKKNTTPALNSAPNSTMNSDGVPVIAPNTDRDIVGNIQLPEGSKLVSSTLEGNRILLKIDTTDGERLLWIYDLGANRVFAKIKVSP